MIRSNLLKFHDEWSMDSGALTQRSLTPWYSQLNSAGLTTIFDGSPQAPFDTKFVSEVGLRKFIQ